MASTERPDAKTPPALALKIPPLALAAFAGLTMWSLPALGRVPIFVSWHAWVCAGLALAGVGVCLAGVLAFRQARTTVDPMHPAKATTLVVRGIYHHTRNPMYLGFLLVLLAWALYLSTLSALAILPLFVWYLTVFQIEPEEDALRERFGVDFDLYSARVRRWL